MQTPFEVVANKSFDGATIPGKQYTVTETCNDGQDWFKITAENGCNWVPAHAFDAKDGSAQKSALADRIAALRGQGITIHGPGGDTKLHWAWCDDEGNYSSECATEADAVADAERCLAAQ